MSVNEFDMYPYVRQNLRARYPLNEGWTIAERERRDSYEPDFVVERKTWSGTIERVVVEVKAECKITAMHIMQLNEYARNLAGKNVRIIKKILVIPTGADASIVPDDIEIMWLREFRCEE